jgi:hypothetical protein
MQYIFDVLPEQLQVYTRKIEEAHCNSSLTQLGGFIRLKVIIHLRHCSTNER